MNFDQFKEVQTCYKHMSQGKYIKKEVDKCYGYLPPDYKVSPADKNEKIVAIKMWFETVFLEAISKILPHGFTGQTSTSQSDGS